MKTIYEVRCVGKHQLYDDVAPKPQYFSSAEAARAYAVTFKDSNYYWAHVKEIELQS